MPMMICTFVLAGETLINEIKNINHKNFIYLDQWLNQIQVILNSIVEKILKILMKKITKKFRKS